MTNPTADDVPHFDIVHKLVSVVRHPTMNRMHTVHADLINEAIETIRTLRTNPPPVAEASDDFTLAAEETHRLLWGNHPNSFDEGYGMEFLIALVRRGAEIGAAREREG